MKDLQFFLDFFDETSKNLFQKREFACIGVSPFNSYFTEKKLIEILGWSSQHFQKLAVFLPDTLSAFTLQGAGYTEKQAAYKTRRQDAYLENKVIRACRHLDEEVQSHIEIVKYSEISKSSSYKKSYSAVMEKFNMDNDFKQSCLNVSTLAMISRVEKFSNALTTVEYFLREFPIFIDLPAILSQDSVIFIYHAIPSLIKNLYEDRTWVSPYQGCLELKIKENIIEHEYIMNN